MLSQLQALLGLADRASGQMDYWQEYQGEEIWIRTHSVERGDERGIDFNQTSYIIRGVVEEVMTTPPGFVLSDVDEIVAVSDFSLMFTIGSTESQAITEGPEAFEVIRQIDEKFVSFDTIEQLERGDNVEEATEPFRREQE